MPRERADRRRRTERSPRSDAPNLFRVVVLAPGFDRFGPCERAAWHLSHMRRFVGPAVTNMPAAEAMCERGEPALLRGLSSGDERKPSLLCPPPDRTRGTEVRFLHRHHCVVFVLDTSPSMRTLRSSSAAPPLSTAANALADCFRGLVRPIAGEEGAGGRRHDMFVSVVALSRAVPGRGVERGRRG